MDEIVLKANNREIIGKGVKSLRRKGILPAIIYGHNIDPKPISLDQHDTKRLLSSITSSSLITMDVEGEKITTLIRDRQKDPLTGELLHLDFLSISMTEKLRTNVGLEFSGVSPAITELGGLLVTILEQLEVECFPADLPEQIVVDISGLTEIGDSLYVRDLVIPPDVDILTGKDEVVIVVTIPEAEIEEEEEEVEELEEIEEPEIIERGKVEAESEEQRIEEE